MSSFDTCDVSVADCGQGATPIDKFCSKSSTSNDSSCVLFNWIPYNYGYWEVIENVDAKTISECFYKGVQNSDSDAISWDFNSGVCKLLKKSDPPTPPPPAPAPAPSPPAPAPTLPPPPPPPPPPDPDKDCVALYLKSQVKDTQKNCASVNEKDGSILTMYFDQTTPATMVPRVSSDYQGIDCRKYAVNNSLDTDKYHDGLQDFGDWCAKNPSIDTCKSFCKNDNYAQFCKRNFPISMVVYIIMFTVFLFSVILIYVRKYHTSRVWKGAFGVCIALSIVFGALSVWQGVVFAKNTGGYSGTTNDFTNKISKVPIDCTTSKYDCKTTKGVSKCVKILVDPQKAKYDSLLDCQKSECPASGCSSCGKVASYTPYYIWDTNGNSFGPDFFTNWCPKFGPLAMPLTDKFIDMWKPIMIYPDPKGICDPNFCSPVKGTPNVINYGDIITIRFCNPDCTATDGKWLNSCNQITRSTYPQDVYFKNPNNPSDKGPILLDKSTFYINSLNTNQPIGIELLGSQHVPAWGIETQDPSSFYISKNKPPFKCEGEKCISCKEDDDKCPYINPTCNKCVTPPK